MEKSGNLRDNFFVNPCFYKTAFDKQVMDFSDAVMEKFQKIMESVGKFRGNPERLKYTLSSQKSGLVP